MIRMLTFALAIPVAAFASGAGDDSRRAGTVVVREWVFGGDGGGAGWTLGRDVAYASGPVDSLTIRSEGADPMIFSPAFDPIPVRAGQWIELCLRTDMGGEAAVFWSSRPDTAYGGFAPRQVVSFPLRPGPDPRVYRVFPSWEEDPHIIRFRFDPPAGGPGLHSIHWIRVCEAAAASAEEVPERPDFWIAAGVDVDAATWPSVLGGPAGAVALQSSPVRLAAGERRFAVLDLEAESDSELKITVVGKGYRFPAPERIPARAAAGRCRVSLVVALPADASLSSGTILVERLAGYEGAVVVHSVELSAAPAGPPLLLVEAAGARGTAFTRKGDLLAVFYRARNWGGAGVRAAAPRMETPAGVEIARSPAAEPVGLDPGESAEWEWAIRFPDAGRFPLRFSIAGFPGTDETLTVRVLERPPAQRMGKIPEPVRAAGEYEIGVYYFPRWYEAQNWAPILPFPERKPLLGWYVDLSPDAADWHISWCAASGISFFIYDWYWEEGRRQLYGALEKGYMNARFRRDLKFCLLWANHNRPKTHSVEDLLAVTRFWIDHYFRLPEYYTIDGRPVVVIFAPRNIVSDLGGAEAVREAFEAMRQTCRSAGVLPVYLVACGTGDARTQEALAAQGYDASSGYNYPSISGEGTSGDGYEAMIDGYLELWEAAAAADRLPHIPVLSGGWDSRPWHGAKGRVRAGRAPTLFRRHCLDAKRFLAELSPRNKRILFVEAWNEWGEGSYIEPHAEFGFDYLQAIREVFSATKEAWEPLVPSDVGLSVPLVTGLEKPAVEPTEPPSLSVRIPKGEWKIGGRSYLVESDQILPVKPATRVRVTGEEHVLSGDPVRRWTGGTILRGSLGPFAPTRLPLAVDPASVVVRSATGGGAAVYRPGTDYAFDAEYGGLARNPEGGIPEGERVLVDYDHYYARIDGIDLLPDGSVAVSEGEPVKACPLAPSPPPDAVRLANLFIPFRCEAIVPGSIHPVPTAKQGRVEEVPLFFTGAEFLSRFRTKLRAGEDVTVVFLGDSVTVGGDATTPGLSFVGRFEGELRRIFPDAGLRVVNAGVGGTNSDDGLKRLERDVLAHQPDLVVVEYVNDMGFPPEKIRANYGLLLTRLGEAGTEDSILLTPHLVRPAWMGGFAEAAQALREVAFERQAALGDVAASWTALADLGVPYESLLANGINHPDDRGHWIYAQVLLALARD